MSRGLSIAEQYVDRQARTELFRGHQIELVTGRVVLHALDDHGQPLCGHDKEHLAEIGQPWDATYLPHLPRCRGCTSRTSDAAASRQLGFLDGPSAGAAQASGVDIRTANGTGRENEAAAALRAVLSGHDLRRWMFTDLVTVDEAIRGGVSHPLTISPRLLVRRPALALTTFLHEQLHWLEGPGTDSAIAEARERWPDPPPLAAGGATDPASTWLHISVCTLEYFSLSELLGHSAAAAELSRHTGYAWIYAQILADPGWFSGFLDRHGLRVPGQPPVPRRFVGEPWWLSG
ncbi:MAG: hypothetical protein M3Z75_31955 [Actinomycetota bacterium]|nr:hypothetical protein [Actinomycetota bacterium]